VTVVGPTKRAQTRRLALMAVVALLLATVVAANIAEETGQNPGVDPRASFTFDADGTAVVVSHYGGDELDPAAVYVESGRQGRLGNFDGSAGMACAENVTRLVPGTTCRIPESRYDRLYVVWENEQNRSLILARRGPDPTPTPSPTPTPTPTPVPTDTPTPGATETATPPPTEGGTATGTPTTGTPPSGTPTPTPATTPTATPPNGTATPEPTGTEPQSG